MPFKAVLNLVGWESPALSVTRTVRRIFLPSDSRMHRPSFCSRSRTTLPTPSRTAPLPPATLTWVGSSTPKIVSRLRTITPVVVPDANYLRNPEQRELYLSGLRMAADKEA
jgi:hypothetical protein